MSKTVCKYICLWINHVYNIQSPRLERMELTHMGIRGLVNKCQHSGQVLLEQGTYRGWEQTPVSFRSFSVMCPRCWQRTPPPGCFSQHFIHHLEPFLLELLRGSPIRERGYILRRKNRIGVRSRRDLGKIRQAIQTPSKKLCGVWNPGLFTSTKKPSFLCRVGLLYYYYFLRHKGALTRAGLSRGDSVGLPRSLWTLWENLWFSVQGNSHWLIKYFHVLSSSCSGQFWHAGYFYECQK